MDQFFAAVLFTLFVLFAFILIIRFSAMPDEVDLTTVEFEQRKVAVFDNETARASGLPFITEAGVVAESDTDLLLNVKYYVPQNDRNTYSITIYPDSSDFESRPIILKKGKNFGRTTILFRPDSKFRRQKQTQYLYFYIYRHGEGEYKEKIYVRRAGLAKTWRKKSSMPAHINPSVFHTYP